ncbi:MAG TPA: sulfite exporter TauE/SafE family protein, partial [Nevskiaceae bacterium]|nr:sulfite exporter TauE/SafE family protein [Nevskiaceae bacterium]
DPSQRSLFMRGLLWAALPCGILYGVLALCALAGDAARGALLAAAFGLGTVPGAALGSGSLGTLLRRAGLPSAAPAGALLLIALGLLQAAVVVLHRSLDPAWCRWLA